MTFAFTPGCCCEEGTCLIFSDSGTGSDSTTITGTYEASGNWARTSNRIHPDHAASDQRLLSETAAVNTGSTPRGLLVRATMKGQTGDRMGVAIFVHSSSGDASGAYSAGNFAEATVRFGSGTNGRFNLNVYSGGSLAEAWNEELECSANEYDIDPDVDVTLELCTLSIFEIIGGVTISGSTLVARLTVGSDVYEMGIPNPLSGIYAYPALTTGTDAITGSFIDWEFYHVSDDCEDCLTCYRLEWVGDSNTQLANWTQVAETWIESTTTCQANTGVETSDTSAFLIHTEHWANDNLQINLRICGDDFSPPTIGGIVFSYVDTSTNWRLEVEAYDDDIGFGSVTRYRLTLWKDAEPVWTVDGLGLFFDWADVGIRVYDCTVWVIWMQLVWCAVENAELNNTGRFGVCTGSTVTNSFHFSDYLVRCADDSWTCVDGWIDDPYDPTDPPDPTDPDPGDPTGCCDLSALEWGDEIEATIANITYYGAGGCASCTEVDSAWLTALNATHTLRVNWKSAAYTSAFGSTGLDNPCDLVLTSAGYQLSITAYIVPIDASTCQMFAVLHVPSGGTCGAAYFASNTFSPGDACTSRELLWQSGNLNGCCLNATTGASITLVPV